VRFAVDSEGVYCLGLPSSREDNDEEDVFFLVPVVGVVITSLEMAMAASKIIMVLSIEEREVSELDSLIEERYGDVGSNRGMGMPSRGTRLPLSPACGSLFPLVGWKGFMIFTESDWK